MTVNNLECVDEEIPKMRSKIYTSAGITDKDPVPVFNHVANLESKLNEFKESSTAANAPILKKATATLEDIVKQMDKSFEQEIKDSGRIPGEWEPKAHHGFEYRSLPCNTDIFKILKESFRILRSV